MALRQAVLPQLLAAGGAETQQPQLVGHRRLAAAQPPGGLLLAQAVRGDKLGNGGGLLQVVEVAPLEIFHQGQQGAVLVRHPHQNTGHMAQPRQPGGPEPPLPGHQHIARRRALDAEGLEHPVLADGLGQLPQGLGVEVAAGLLGVGDDALNGNLMDAGGLVELRLFGFHGAASFLTACP